MFVRRIVGRGIVSVGMAGCIGVTTVLGDAEDHAHDDQAQPERQHIFEIGMHAVTASQPVPMLQPRWLITT